MKFVHYRDGGKELASVVLSKDWGTNYYIQQFYKEEDLQDIPADAWIRLITDALAEGKRLSASRVDLRITEYQNSAAVAEALPELQFQKRFDRVEFHTSIDNLPDEQGSPLQWVSHSPSGPWTLDRVAEVFQLAALGDPDCDPSENKAELIRGYLDDPVLTRAPECVQVGLFALQPVALVVAQINPRTAWSRISYMGLHPDYRKRGLGKWVHRHGFEMMRHQGGKTLSRWHGSQ